MYLVDTSVWLDYINGRDCEHVQFLDNILNNPIAIGLNEFIYMEILQGAKNQKMFDQFNAYFSSQSFYTFKHTNSAHAAAAKIFFNCRRQGITVRSSMDCLIAQCAIENKVTLLHNDRDFVQIATVIPQLQQEHFL